MANTSLIPIIVLAAVILVYGWAAVRMVKSRFTRTGVRLFLIVGSVLAVIRVGWLWFLAYRMRTHTWSESLQQIDSIAKYLFPEAIVTALIPTKDPYRSTLFLSFLLIVGSFFWASILLLVGAQKKE
jgi:hypothetical protein